MIAEPISHGSISHENVQVLSTLKASTIALSDGDYAKQIKQGLVDSISESLEQGKAFKVFFWSLERDKGFDGHTQQGRSSHYWHR